MVRGYLCQGKYDSSTQLSVETGDNSQIFSYFHNKNKPVKC